MTELEYFPVFAVSFVPQCGVAQSDHVVFTIKPAMRDCNRQELHTMLPQSTLFMKEDINKDLMPEMNILESIRRTYHSSICSRTFVSPELGTKRPTFASLMAFSHKKAWLEEVAHTTELVFCLLGKQTLSQIFLMTYPLMYAMTLLCCRDSSVGASPSVPVCHQVH